MSARRRDSEAAPAADPGQVLENGPGLVYMPFVVMEDLLDKLKLLDYEQQFITTQLKMRPLNRHYFVVQTNPGEQFFLFTSIAAWLVRRAGRSMEAPQEFDDPNSVIANILEHLRHVGVAIDFAPSKLKQGFGEQVIYVLDRLADEALKASEFQWGRPEPASEPTEPDEAAVDEAELNLERVEEEMAADYSDEDEDEILHIDELTPSSTALAQRPDDILPSSGDSNAWYLEVERVAPQLKVTLKVDVRDWRTHLEQMHRHRSGIEEALTSTRSQLDKMHSDIGKTLDKISSREKYINSQLEGPLTDFRRLIDNLAATKEQYKQVSGGVSERSRLLGQISDELEAVKAEMEERGSSMTDGTPLVSIRKSLAKIKQDILSMDVRIGVVQHMLVQAKLKDKSNVQRDLHLHLSSAGNNNNNNNNSNLNSSFF